MPLHLKKLREIAPANIAARCENAIGREFASPEEFETYMAATPTGVATERLVKIRAIGAACIVQLVRAYPFKPEDAQIG